MEAGSSFHFRISHGADGHILVYDGRTMPLIEPIARPRLTSPRSEVDLAIVGAGAAGIAAARYAQSRGLTVCVLEARDRVGGRAVTAAFGGHPVDLGAHWLHAGRRNPLVALGSVRGEPIRPAPTSGYVVEDRRIRSGPAIRDGRRAFQLADRAFSEAAKSPDDVSLARVMPPLGRLSASVAATMALLTGRPLEEASVKDFPSDEFGDNYFIRGGYGAYLARLASGLPIALGQPVRAIDWSGETVRLSTPRGEVRAGSVIVTVPVPVLAAGAIAFRPSLPAGIEDAIGTFLAGTYEHVVLNWPDAPFSRPDRIVRLNARRSNFGLMARMDGAPFHYLELDYATVVARRHLGRPGLAAFARSLLSAHFGARAIDLARVLHVTDWTGDPWSRCAWAVAPPGAAHSRDVISRPVGDRLWLAGEANDRTMWGTVGGAWQAGERAAREIVGRLASRSHISSASRHGVVSNTRQTS